MDWIEISKIPTIYEDENTGSSHESLLRAFNILEEVKELLILKTPSSIILKIIAVMEMPE
jgi:hypothetical protein